MPLQCLGLDSQGQAHQLLKLWGVCVCAYACVCAHRVMIHLPFKVTSQRRSAKSEKSKSIFWPGIYRPVTWTIAVSAAFFLINTNAYCCKSQSSSKTNIHSNKFNANANVLKRWYLVSHDCWTQSRNWYNLCVHVCACSPLKCRKHESKRRLVVVFKTQKEEAGGHRLSWFTDS